MDSDLITLFGARRGHFLFESGHHGELWLDLDALFAQPSRLRAPTAELAAKLAVHGVEVICGPCTGGALLAHTIACELGVEFSYAERHVHDRADGVAAVEYRLPGALRGHVLGKRVAIVDDVINAGSAVRATLTDLRACGARPVALGALLVLGTSAARLAAEEKLALENSAQLASNLWLPSECPLCAAGVPLSCTA